MSYMKTSAKLTLYKLELELALVQVTNKPNCFAISNNSFSGISVNIQSKRKKKPVI